MRPSLRQILVYWLFYFFSDVRSAYRWFGLVPSLKYLSALPITMLTRNGNWARRAMGRVRFRPDRWPYPLVWEMAAPYFIFEIFEKREYELEGLIQVKPGDIVVDAGAHIGTFTLWAASQNPWGKIVAVEPNAQFFRYLAENVRVNNLKNVLLEHAAIAREDAGEVFVKSAGVRAPTVSFASLFQKYQLDKIDLLKMDIEGAEYEVFEDTGWLAPVRRCVMEAHVNHGDPRFLVSQLEKAGFRVVTRPAMNFGNWIIYAYRGGAE